MSDLTPTAEGGDDAPLRWPDVFAAECRQLTPSFEIPPGGGDDEARLTRLNQAAFDEERAALCLSGGGIRSASFAVGVLQGLAQRGLLPRFDYLSTVSGGGFAGGWFTAWLHRARTDPSSGADAHSEDTAGHALDEFMGQSRATSDVEPWPVGRLRLFTRYMSPATGFFSADSWTLAATMLRNMLLNWAVLLPLLAAAMLVPRLQFALIHLLEQEPNSATSLAFAEDVWALTVAVVAYVIALIHIVASLPSYGNRGGSEPRFLALCLLPLSVGTLALTYYWATWGQVDFVLARFVLGGAVMHGLVWAITGMITGARPFRPRTWIAAFVAGGVGALIYYGIVSGLFNYDDLSKSYVSFAFPLVMGGLVLQAVVFVGLAGREMSAADLEWWSRAAAWILIVAAAWLIVCAVGFGIPALFDWLVNRLPGAIHALSGLTAMLGGITSWLLRPSGEPAKPSALRRLALAIAAPAFVVLIIGGAATADEKLVRMLALSGDDNRFMAPFQTWPICAPAQEADYARYRCHPADGGFAETAVLLFGLLALGLIASRFVPANRFSLHDMYHHRVTRAYLGASRYRRRPNPFTGFDADDDLELAAVANQRPLHVVNTTLNTHVNARLGRQERTALSFTFSPLHAGSSALGWYRPSREFAFDPLRRRGITLGGAVTISGAAASPQMGQFTTPSMAFLLALLNARLGVWLGNPGPSGRDTWRARDPKSGIAPIVREMLGWTAETNPYVLLSDGGHFDNLGLWEMVLRRCRHIVVVDAGCDPDYRFEDLANAVRRARIDHGVEIVFDPETMDALREAHAKPHVVTGTIRYPENAPGVVGSIVYIKPALSGDEPVDVTTYRASHATFPHESTANQWFTEAQFESYRALGWHSVEAALADQSSGGLGTLARHLLRQSLHVREARPEPAHAGLTVGDLLNGEGPSPEH